MPQFLRPYRNVVIPFALILVSSLVWISNTKVEKERNLIDRSVVFLSTPIVRAITASADFVSESWRNYVWFVGLRRQHDGAIFRIQALENELNRLEEYRRENGRLREILDFRDRDSEESFTTGYVVAKVVGMGGGAFARTIHLDRGYGDGIRQGMPVVTPAGVVGRVVKARGGYAEVALVLDPNNAVPVRIQRTRAQGILEGAGSEICRIKYVSRASDVVKGDRVVTSGLAGVFPGGLVVGTVDRVRKKAGTVTQEVLVRPSVDFRRLPDEVLVVTQVFQQASLGEEDVSKVDLQTSNPKKGVDGGHQ